MISELSEFLYKYKKEVALIIITALTTFVFTKVLPTLFALAKELGAYLFALVTGRRKEYRFEKRYLSWLINEHKYLIIVPSQIINPDRLPKQPELEDVYIQLQLKHTHEKVVNLPVSELVKKSSKTVILGDPGSGKTTLLKYTCLTYARLANTSRVFFNKRRSLKARFQSTGRQIPILIYLNRLSGDSTILSTAEAALPESLHAIYPQQYFQKLLEAGKAIVLLDGLDEISSQSDRDKVAQAINSLSNASHEDNIWLVTSRIVGYKAQLQNSFA
ncbi:MAG: NACHT domain-containing protein, partial [Chitinophagaceae bacterium]